MVALGRLGESNRSNSDLTRLRVFLSQGHPTDRFGKLSFRKAFIPSDFLKKIVTSNFRDMRNLMSVVFGLLKMSF